MTHSFEIFIDEAGDEGFGKLRLEKSTGQSQWFVVGACVVRASRSVELVTWRDEIANAIGRRGSKRDIHFKEIRRHDQRRFACRTIASKRLAIAAAFSNKPTLLDLPPSRQVVFKRKNHIHNYVCRYLLERLSVWIARVAREESIDPRTKITFSRRGGMNYDDFREYLRLIRSEAEKVTPPRQIDWTVVDPDLVTALDHKISAGLQIADIATSGLFKAVEPSPYGFCEPSYAEELRRVIIRKSDAPCAFNCGITIVPRYQPASMTEEQRAFFQSWM